jgi:hypothetical protein
MSQVPLLETPFTPAELIAGLTSAFTAEMGQPPSHAALAILCGQLALETDNGRACQNHNPGNYKRGMSADWYDAGTTEYIDGIETKMVCPFSAFPTLAAGLTLVVRGLHDRFPEAWAAEERGDPDGFAEGLKLRGYYTAPEPAYAAGVKRWESFYLALLGGDEAVTEPELAPADAAALAVAGMDVRAEYQPGT